MRNGYEFKSPSHYTYLEPYVEALLRDNPFENNVFLMVSYAKTPQLDEIRKALCNSLLNLGLNPLMAANKSYHPNLWENICVYMLASQFGIAVFEEIEKRELNPNIAIELGFMTALGRRCLPLKEKHMRPLPVNVGGLLSEEFDCYNITASINSSVHRWVIKDLDLSRLAAEQVTGYYSSEWRRGSEVLGHGKARVEGTGTDLHILLRDEAASTYAANGRLVGPHEFIASWFNVDHPSDYGSWQGRISDDFRSLHGEWVSSFDGTKGEWRLRRLKKTPPEFQDAGDIADPPKRRATMKDGMPFMGRARKRFAR